jgi:small conductance mechanosensitive channel
MLERKMFRFDTEQMSQVIDTYIIPWGIDIVMAIAIYIIGKFTVGILVNVFGRVMARSKYDEMLIDFIKAIVNSILMLFVIIASLDKLGVNTSSMVAIFGAAGLAIGLSLQGSLQNFAAGVMLLVFRPFKSGDFIDAGGEMGTVMSISIFTTIMTTPDNKQIIVPNGNVYGGNITNFSANATRRVDMVIGISYDSDLRKAKEILNEMVAADERILKDPVPMVAVSELAESSVNFVVRPWVKSADFWAVKFDYTEAVKLRFDSEGISIPFPQMDVHVHKND